jgi:diguanylate cyclase (GGDEF)-like protein
VRDRATHVYISLTAVGALLVVVGGCFVPQMALDWAWWGVGLLLASCVLTETHAVEVTGGAKVSVATIPHLVAALLLPPPLAALVAASGLLIVQLHERAPPSKLTFNVASLGATVGLTGVAAHAFGLAGSGLAESSVTALIAFFVIALTYYAVNNLSFAGVVAVSTGMPFFRTLTQNARASAPPELAVAVIGGLVAVMWVVRPVWLPLVFFPGLIAQLTLRYISTSGRQTAELAHQALHDPLTGLANRVLLRQRILSALVDVTDASPLALLMLDLDRFKEVNDTFGHHYGDRLLREAAQRLVDTIGTAGTVARLGGDEFAILLPAAGTGEAEETAAQVVSALKAPVELDGYALEVSASVGLSLALSQSDDADTLLRRADVAMYVAKRGGTEWAAYAPEQEQNTPDTLALIGELRRAIEQRELILNFQPQVDVSTERVVGVEALARWPHPRRGWVPPDQFIPLAEHTGLMRPLSRWVLQAAVIQARAWQLQGIELPVAVNLSASNLQDSMLPDNVAGLLQEHGLSANRLQVEVTESALMVDREGAAAVLGRLRALGVRVSVDDFGTGHSSLAYLKDLPVDELKIDKAFVQHLAFNPKDRAIVRAIIGLAHELGLVVVAEGVEDRATWEILRRSHCDIVQGFFLSRPISAADVTAWLSDFQSGVQPVLHALREAA